MYKGHIMRRIPRLVSCAAVTVASLAVSAPQNSFRQCRSAPCPPRMSASGRSQPSSHALPSVGGGLLAAATMAEFLQDPSPGGRRDALRALMTRAVTPRIVLSDDELDSVLLGLKALHDDFKRAASSDDSETIFCRVLQQVCPLVTPKRYTATLESVEARDGASPINTLRMKTIDSALSELDGLSDDRKQQCKAEGNCTWTVRWSTDVEAFLAALQTTALGTVHDTFAHDKKRFLENNCGGTYVSEVADLIGPVAWVIVSDEARNEIVVSKQLSLRFVRPLGRRIVKPDYVDVGGSPKSETDQLLLVFGPSGAGKSMASLWFALNGPTGATTPTFVLYCKAADFLSEAPSHFTEGRSGAADGSPRAQATKQTSPTADLSDGAMLLAAYVKRALLRGCADERVVPSHCSVAIVIDEVGSSLEFVSHLIEDYRALTRQLQRILQVDSVRIIAAGTGTDGFGRKEVTSDRRRMVTMRHIQTAMWAELSKHLKKERPYVIPALCKAIESSAAGERVDSVVDLLRAALSNARFACVFANHVYSTEPSGLPMGDVYWANLAVDVEAAASGLYHLAVTAMYGFARLSGLASAPNLGIALRTAVSAMIDREPFNDEKFPWSHYAALYGVVTFGGAVLDRGTYRKLCKNKELVVLRSRVLRERSSVSYTWVDGFDENAEGFEVLLRGRPFYMVDRAYCSMYMLLFGGMFPLSTWRGFEQAVMNFASIAVSQPSAALEGRTGVPPLRRLLNQLGTETEGTFALRMAAPQQIDLNSDWAVVDRAKAEAKFKSNGTPPVKADAFKAATCRAQRSAKESTVAQQFWQQLAEALRSQRGCSILNGEGATGANGFVVAPDLLALFQCKSFFTAVLDAAVVRLGLLRMAPVIAHPDCVVEDGATDALHTKKPFPDRWKQQRVPEELVALARGVTFKRCEKTHRAFVRRPPTGAANAPPAFIVNVAVVFEGDHSGTLQDLVLCNAFGRYWSDLAGRGGCSGPFAVLETAAPGSDRARAEVVLDYVLDQPRDEVLRVAYRYFLVDVTWRRVAPRSTHEGGSRGNACPIAWDEALPPLYPVPQSPFPAV